MGYSSALNNELENRCVSDLVDFDKNYDIMRGLGNEAQQEKVFLVMHQASEKEFVLKLFPMALESNFGALIQTLDVLRLRESCSKLLVRYYGYTITKFAGIVMVAVLIEYVEGHTIQDYAIRSYTTGKLIGELEAIKVMRLLCHAVKCLLDHDIVLTDLKEDNIMFNDQGVKLIDLDDMCLLTSKGYLSHLSCEGHQANLMYFSPELIQYLKLTPDDLKKKFVYPDFPPPGYSKKMIEATLVWVLGICSYSLINGKRAYKTSVDVAVNNPVTGGLLNTQRLNSIVQLFLTRDYNERPGLDELEALLRSEEGSGKSKPTA